MNQKKLFLLFGILVCFGMGITSCTNPNAPTDEEGTTTEETTTSNFHISFDMTALKGLAITEGPTSNKNAVGTSTTDTLLKITEDGELEKFLKLPEDNSITLYNITQILKAPSTDSKEIYILFDSQGIYRTPYKETDEWGNSWDSFKYNPIGKLLCIFENGEYLDILQPTDSEYKDPFNLTFDNNGNLFYCVSENNHNNGYSKDVIYKFDPKTRQSTKLVPAISGTNYDKFYISKNADWIIVQGRDNYSYFLQAIPVNNTENAYNIWYSSNSWGSSDWIYDESTKDVYFITDGKLYRSPYKNGGYNVNDNIIVAELSSNKSTNFYSDDILEWQNFWKYKLAGRAYSYDFKTHDYKDYLFINPNTEEIDYSEIVNYCFGQLLFHLNDSNKTDDNNYYINYRNDYEIRFDIFSNIPGFEELSTETKDQNGYNLSDEELFKTIIEKNLLSLLAKAVDDERYTKQNVYRAYNNNIFTDILYLKGTNTRIDPSLFRWKESIGFETFVGTNDSSGNFGFISEEYYNGYYWKKDYVTGTTVDPQKVLAKFAELCEKDKIDFSLKNYKNDTNYSSLYTELINEEAILFLSETSERMQTLYDAMIPDVFLRKTCFFSGTDRPIFTNSGYDSYESFSGFCADNLVITENGIFGCYNNRVVQLTNNTNNPVLKYVSFSIDEELKIIDTSIYNNKYFFKNSILSEQGAETGCHNILSFDPAQQTPTLENVLWNMDGNNQYKITSYTITDNYLYGCFVKGTKVIIGKINLNTKQYEKFSESDSDSGFKQILMLK